MSMLQVHLACPMPASTTTKKPYAEMRLQRLCLQGDPLAVTISDFRNHRLIILSEW